MQRGSMVVSSVLGLKSNSVGLCLFHCKIACMSGAENYFGSTFFA